MSWVSAAIAGAGLVTNLYGANKQRQDQKGADSTNRAAIAKADQDQWNAYLLQRGLNGGGAVPYGQVPTNAAPVNTRLPLWSNLTTGMQPSAGPLVRRKAGAPPVQPGGMRYIPEQRQIA